MTISHKVILDLLPLYLADEASEETRQLLEQYLRENPEFAASVRDRAEKVTALLASVPASVPAAHEKATFDRVRRFNRVRTCLLAFGIFLTLTPFAFGFGDGGVRWMMLRDNPTQAVLFGIAALACWTVYSIMGRRLRHYTA
jgi:hypothetical protein